MSPSPPPSRPSPTLSHSTFISRPLHKRNSKTARSTQPYYFLQDQLPDSATEHRSLRTCTTSSIMGSIAATSSAVLMVKIAVMFAWVLASDTTAVQAVSENNDGTHQDGEHYIHWLLFSSSVMRYSLNLFAVFGCSPTSFLGYISYLLLVYFTDRSRRRCSSSSRPPSRSSVDGS